MLAILSVTPAATWTGPMTSVVVRRAEGAGGAAQACCLDPPTTTAVAREANPDDVQRTAAAASDVETCAYSFVCTHVLLLVEMQQRNCCMI